MVKDLGISKSTITFKVNLYKLIKKIPKCLHCILPFPSWAFLCTLNSWVGVKLPHLNNF